MASIRIAVVEDRDLVRYGLQAVIGKLENCQLTAVCADIADLNKQLQHDCPHILILDDTLPGIDTPNLVRRLKEEYPALKIIVFGSNLAASNLYDLYDANADGFVFKGDEVLDTLRQAVSSVIKGKVFISPDVSTSVLTYRKSSRPIELSERLKVVLSLMALDFSVKEIAQTLGISDKAVYNARDRLKELLHANNPADILSRAIALKLIEPKDTQES